MHKETYSLREIGRRLDIPPSTISYYKDRFLRFIPVAGGQGRRVKYPAEAVILFREIREMFTRNWSAEQIEEQLATIHHVATGIVAEGVTSLGTPEQGRTQAFVQDLSGVLDKMSTLLEAQAHFRTEVDGLREEVALLRREKADLIAAYEDKIRELDVEMEQFRRERAELLQHLGQQAQREASRAAGPMPEAELQARPLVVRIGGEFLGVAGKGKPFALQDFIHLIRRNAGSQKVLDMAWSKGASTWHLQVHTQDDSGRGHAYALRIAPTVTPSGNAVTELVEMSVDGDIVPDKFVLMLFKNMKDGLER